MRMLLIVGCVIISVITTVGAISFAVYLIWLAAEQRWFEALEAWLACGGCAALGDEFRRWAETKFPELVRA